MVETQCERLRCICVKITSAYVNVYTDAGATQVKTQYVTVDISFPYYQDSLSYSINFPQKLFIFFYIFFTTHEITKFFEKHTECGKILKKILFCVATEQNYTSECTEKRRKILLLRCVPALTAVTQHRLRRHLPHMNK